MEGLIAEAATLGKQHTNSLKLHQAENLYNLVVLGGKQSCSGCTTTFGAGADGNTPAASSSVKDSSASLADRIAASRAKVESALGPAPTAAAAAVVSQTSGQQGGGSRSGGKKSRNKRQKRLSTAQSDDSSGGEVAALRKELGDVKAEMAKLNKLVLELQTKMASLTTGGGKVVNGQPPKKEEKKESTPDDDDFELFGSDEEDDEEKEKLKQQRLEAYAAKKAKKPGVIAKSSVILDVKPWDDETDMGAMEKQVRTIQMDGLLWGPAKLVPVGYGIKKLQIGCVVEDEKVSIDDLQEQITEFEDFVQSVDIAAFNKI